MIPEERTVLEWGKEMLFKPILILRSSYPTFPDARDSIIMTTSVDKLVGSLLVEEGVWKAGAGHVSISLLRECLVVRRSIPLYWDCSARCDDCYVQQHEDDEDLRINILLADKAAY